MHAFGLYLYAVFTELGYAISSDAAVPDFIFSDPMGAFGIEATSATPPQGSEPRTLPKNRKDLSETSIRRDHAADQLSDDRVRLWRTGFNPDSRIERIEEHIWGP